MAICLLEYLGDRTPIIIGPDADAFRKSIQKDIEYCEKNGLIFDIPDEVPFEYSIAKVANLLENKRLAPLIYFMRSIFDGYSIEKLFPKDKNSLNLLEAHIDNVLSKLTDQEKKIIELHYGFDDCNYLSFDEIGDVLEISSNEVQQIHEKCKEKLTKPSIKEELKEYFYRSIEEINLDFQKRQNKNL